MAAGKHIGKVIIKVRDEKESLNNLPLALPRYHCLQDRSYIILGGLGGFGLELGNTKIHIDVKSFAVVNLTETIRHFKNYSGLVNFTWRQKHNFHFTIGS